MSSELTIFENQLRPMQRQFEDVLADRMPADRLIRTLVMACQKTPSLLSCDRQSLLNSGMTFGVLALETDGVTGQGYILPFKKIAQPVIGYKGYNTIGARSRLTLTGEVVREGDEFDYSLGTKAFVHHKPSLDDTGRIIAAWSQAEAFDRPPIVVVLGLAAIEAVRRKSPGASRSESPWNDPTIGLPAMYSKTAKRRLARSTPMEWARPEFQQAAVMEEAFEERGKLSYVHPSRGVVIEGEDSPIAPRQNSDTPTAQDLTGHAPDPELEELKTHGKEAADGGSYVLRQWWESLSPRQQRVPGLVEYRDGTLKPAAERADQE